MKVRGQFHASAPWSKVKTPVSIDYGTGWVPKAILDVIEKGEKQSIAPARIWTLPHPAHSLWTILGVLSQLQTRASYNGDDLLRWMWVCNKGYNLGVCGRSWGQQAAMNHLCLPTKLYCVYHRRLTSERTLYHISITCGIAPSNVSRSSSSWMSQVTFALHVLVTSSTDNSAISHVTKDVHWHCLRMPYATQPLVTLQWKQYLDNGEKYSKVHRRGREKLESWAG
jgi:hypothetical protein